MTLHDGDRRASSGDQWRFPAFAYSSVQDATHRLAVRARESRLGPFHELPYNHFEPEDTDWWLSPSSDNPAYKYGKIVLSAGPPAAPADLLVGLHVEKGIGPSAAEAFRDTARGRRLTMDRTWLWFAFIEALSSGRLTADAADAEAAAGLPLTVWVNAGPQNPPLCGEDNVQGEGWKPDRVDFQFSSGRLTCLGAATPEERLSSLATAETFPEIADGLRSMPGADWVWVDFVVGLRFAAAGPPTEGSAWAADAVWQKACLPWSSWLK